MRRRTAASTHRTLAPAVVAVVAFRTILHGGAFGALPVGRGRMRHRQCRRHEDGQGQGGRDRRAIASHASRRPQARHLREDVTSASMTSARKGWGAHCAGVPCRPSAFTWQPLRGSRRSIPVPKRNHAETLTHRADLQGGHTHRRRGGKRRQAQYAVSVIRPAPHKGSTWPR